METKKLAEIIKQTCLDELNMDYGKIFEEIKDFFETYPRGHIKLYLGDNNKLMKFSNGIMELTIPDVCENDFLHRLKIEGFVVRTDFKNDCYMVYLCWNLKLLELDEMHKTGKTLDYILS